MKVVALREAKASLSGYIEKAQKDRVLITKHGKPAALVIGVEGEEMEDLLTMGNPRFWEMVEARRQSNQTVALQDVRRQLGITGKRTRTRRTRSR
jgi:prevent-host-death family protein